MNPEEFFGHPLYNQWKAVREDCSKLGVFNGELQAGRYDKYGDMARWVKAEVALALGDRETSERMLIELASLEFTFIAAKAQDMLESEFGHPVSVPDEMWRFKRELESEFSRAELEALASSILRVSEMLERHKVPYLDRKVAESSSAFAELVAFINRMDSFDPPER